MNDGEENPIASGLVALVAVAVVVGLLAGIAVLAGTRMLGVSAGGGGSSSGVAGGGPSLVMPAPVPTQRQSDPLITLAPTAEPTQTSTAQATRTPVEPETTDGEPQLVLTASPLSVASGEEVMLSGTYVRGEGSVLDIWYAVDGGPWEEFGLDVNVSGSIFQINVQTWKTGTIQWQVRDESSGRKSEPVTVHYGA